MCNNLDHLIREPIVLEPVEVSRAWGGETWLNSTQREGRAIVSGAGGLTLAELVEQRPEVLGRWSRLLFGDSLPIFTKFLRTNFPPLVHMGFSEKVEKKVFLGWLEFEQARLSELLAALSLPDEGSFEIFQRAYEGWAVAEALTGWKAARPNAAANFELAARALTVGRLDLANWVKETKENRARVVSVLNEVDLRKESGNLLLMSAGMPHAIFGLSHQTHPLDNSRTALQDLFAGLRRAVARGASGEEMEAAARAAELDSLRQKNTGAPKNEAWLPFVTDAGLVLVEPQQTSNTTYSFADFYTPFSWKGGPAFRKGDPSKGVGSEELSGFLDSLDFTPVPVGALRCTPLPAPSRSKPTRAAHFEIINEPENWPFFTAREVVLTGSPAAVASWTGRAPEGAFLQVVAVEGSALLSSEEKAGPAALSPSVSAFIPATMGGSFTLKSDSYARILLFSVPVPEDLKMQDKRDHGGQRPSFLNYDPVPLAFGTSGLRGLVKDITDLEAYINTRGFLNFLVKSGGASPGETVTVAGDLRPSSDRIMAAVARGILDSGFKVENSGKIPTPALTYRAMQANRPSVMVTGSHIPFDRNGIKFNRRDGEVLKEDEGPILSEVAAVRAEEYARAKGETPFDGDGMLSGSASDLPEQSGEGRELYIKRYIDFFPEKCFEGMCVIVDQHSAVGRDILVDVLKGLGAKVLPSGRSETFIPVDTENVTEEQLSRLDAVAREHDKAGGRAFAIVSTDGDSDRPLLVAVLDTPDEKGRIVRFFGGDVLGIVVAEYLGAEAAAVPVSASDAVGRHLAKIGIKRAMTRIGSPYVISAMKELGRLGFKKIVSWEANGGFLTGTDIELCGRELKALPTRDAMLPLLSALHSAWSKGVSLAELFGRLPARHNRAGLLDNVPQEVSRAMVSRFSPSDREIIEVTFTGGGLTATDDAWHEREVGAGEALAVEMAGKGAEISRFFAPAEGFGRVVKINSLDGVRIFFDNGDIAHIRASGNAPQLRIYANCDTAARAEEIVAMCLREPDGIYRKIQSELGPGAAK